MQDLRSLYLESCGVVMELVARPEVADRWASASSLPELSVGALAAHLGRAVVTVDAYLRAETPVDDATPLDAAGYFAAVLVDHDPLTSEFHRGVRIRSESAAEGGQQGLLDDLSVVLDRLRQMPDDMDVQLAVLAGIQMSLGEYLKTRLVEIAVHCRDLTDSVNIAPAPLGAQCWQVASAVIVEVAVRRHSAEEVALMLSRTDRFDRIAAF